MKTIAQFVFNRETIASTVLTRGCPACIIMINELDIELNINSNLNGSTTNCLLPEAAQLAYSEQRLQ